HAAWCPFEVRLHELLHLAVRVVERAEEGAGVGRTVAAGRSHDAIVDRSRSLLRAGAGGRQDGEEDEKTVTGTHREARAAQCPAPPVTCASSRCVTSTDTRSNSHPRAYAS